MKLRIIMLVAVFCSVATSAHSETRALCTGHHETVAKEILETKVRYWLWYKEYANYAKVKFAGHEFKASIRKGSYYGGEGHWYYLDDDDIRFSYIFSFFPDKRGEVKFKMRDNVYFKGYCR